MFSKLLKYELRGNYKKFLMFYGAFILTILVITMLDTTAKMTIINNPMQIAYGVVFILTMIEFKKEINSSDAYLTFSLPVKKSHILAIKLTNYFFKLITIFISIVLLSLWCVLLKRNTFSALYNELVDIKWDLLYYSMVCTLNSVMYILMIWLIIAICKMEHLNKSGSAIIGSLAFVLVNLVIGLFGLITLSFNWILPVHSLGNSIQIIQIGRYGNLTFEIYKVIVVVILFIFTSNLLEHKVDV